MAFDAEVKTDVALEDQLIEHAAEILSNPKRWSKGCLARNSLGKSVQCGSLDAVSFCLVGALTKARGRVIGSTEETVNAACDKLSDVLHVNEPLWNGGIVNFNDDELVTHARLMSSVFGRRV